MSLRKQQNDNPTKSLSLIQGNISQESDEMKDILNVMEKLLHWAAIIDSSDDAIISKSIDGYITSWNKGAQRLYGYAPEEIIGKPVSTLMPPEKKDDFPFILKQLHEGKRIEHYETQRMTKDGKTIHVSITVSPIKDSHGNIIGASKIARDITDRIEAAKRRDEFVSTASHELKTPLTSLKAFGELLEELIVQNDQKLLLPYIQKINRQTQKLTKLVEDLLELSRVEMGRLSMESKRFNMDQLVEEIIEETQMTTKHKIINQGKTGKLVKGDRERIGQVLINLLSNAIKYSPKANKVIVNSLVNGSFVQISVQDFGIGILPMYHSKIFEQFYRVTDENEKTYPGMGIGLHVSNEIASYHKGKIWVKSEKGKGSTFFLQIPFIK